MNLIGLKVILDRPTCCGNVCIIGPGKPPPHLAALRCADCDRHHGWVSNEAVCFLESVVAIFGEPAEPIVVRKVANTAPAAVIIEDQEMQRRICEVDLRLAKAGLERKHLLLTWPPLRDWILERERHRIRQLAFRYGIFVPFHKLSSDTGAVGRM